MTGGELAAWVSGESQAAGSELKKTIYSTLFLVTALTLAACGNAASNDAPAAVEPAQETTESTTERETVTIVDFDGQSIEVQTNPKTVAIYDFGVLDILYNVGFEKTGIETLIIPNSTGGLPASLSYFEDQDFIHFGGTLFYVDHDVLDLLQLELVILGARSFGMNANGDRLNDEEWDAFREETFNRYDETTFIRLGPGREINLVQDIQTNARVLAAIFPDLADEIEAELATILAGIAEVHDKAEASGSTAIFAMMMDATSLSVFNPGSRFNMLYEEFGFAPADAEAPAWTDAHGFDARAEYLLSINPDVIFVLDRSNNMVGPGPAFDNILADPIVAQTTAAQNGNIIALDPTSWYTITGGFGAARQMIADLMEYLD
ncbi:MAG: ABC transporter substrate-binding protein [Turicibacter sp.]|nr:ABC transporter substrate-binding protein [Turicibacter sp.]